MFKGFYRPYFTIFDEKFSELKGEKFIKNGLLLGVTNPLFNKTLNNICYALRLDREHLQFQRAKFGNTIPPKKLLIGFKNKPRMKSSVVISNVLSNNGSPEADQVNNTIVKKTLLELTFNFLEPLHIYFNQQYNVS